MPHSRWAAPTKHGEVLIDPPLKKVGDKLSGIQRSFQQKGRREVFGRPLSEFRQLAQREFLRAATLYLGDEAPTIKGSGMVLCGHQPEMFHPGVWLKNFLIQGLARRHKLIPVNLIVDSDVCGSASLRMPVLDSNPCKVTVRSIPFADVSPKTPYENLHVESEEQFANVAVRAAEVHGQWGFEPLFPEYWREVVAQRQRTTNIGERLAAARRVIERRWGCHNFEVPVSQLCRTESFKRFFDYLMADLPRFHEVHNECLSEYREEHRIRSRSHPFPELASDRDWLEAPFWAVSEGGQSRGRVFARPRHGHPSYEWRVVAPPVPAGPKKLRIWHFRPRAVTLTLYARLLLADLFVHGIGGAIYDQLTDTIIRRYVGFEPPPLVVASATLRLDLPAFPSTAADRRRRHRMSRDLFWNPQQFITSDTAQAKQEQIKRNPKTALERAEHFRVLRGLTELMRPAVEGRRAEVLRELARCDGELAANDILNRRDYAFCLYPSETLRPFLTRFCDG